MLRELILALQGYHGDVFIKQPNELSESDLLSAEEPTPTFKSKYVFRIDPKFSLIHPSEREGYDRLVQLGYYYIQLKDFASLFYSPAKEEYSIYINALKQGIDKILEGYEELIVRVESGFLSGRDFDYGSTTVSYLMGIFTHYRIILPDLLDFVETVVEAKMKGGQILSLVYQRTFTGVPGLEEAYSTIAFECNRVFYKQILLWIGCGDISDQHNEFFIKCEASKYSVVIEKVPTWLSERSTNSILFVGRVVKAVQKIDPTHSSQGLQEKAKTRLMALAQRTKLAPLELESTLSELRREISGELWTNVFSRRLDLKGYIRDFRNLFLLSFGGFFSDFFAAAHKKSSSSRNGLLLTEISLLFSTSSPGFDNDSTTSLAKFHFRKMDSPKLNFLKFLGCHTPIEWTYDLEWPLDLILQEEDISVYSRLFSYLAGVRYVHLDLYRLCEFTKKPPNWWSPFGPFKANMQHFLDSLWSYLQVDILDPAYFALLADLENPALAYDFESIQSLHSDYLTHISFATLMDTKIAGYVLTLLEIIHSFTSASRQLLEKGHIIPSQEQLGSLQKESEEFLAQLKFIFRTLSSLGCTPDFSGRGTKLPKQERDFIPKPKAKNEEHVNRSLDQLLLRLDFNKWFSQNL